MSIRRLVMVGLGCSEVRQVSVLLAVADPDLIFDVLCCFQALADALKTNSSVRDINLAVNQIGPEGVKARPISDVLGSLAWTQRTSTV